MPPLHRLPEDGLIAAIDMGSNSFHLAVARLDHGELKLVEGLSEKVRLGGGLDANNHLTEEAQARALACLSRFAQHLEGIAPNRLRIVGTNALRVARNAAVFLQKAEKILHHPVEIIAGREEARLIYMGVAHTLASPDRRLIIDIGGGSTELIIGQRFEPLLLESTHMGCVSYASRFFAEGVISPKAMERAITAARQTLAPLLTHYRDMGWESVVGSSGTFKAMCQVANALGLDDGRHHLTAQAVQELLRQTLKFTHIREIALPGIKDDRKAVLPAGLSIVVALFEELGISSLEYSDGALREGVLHDLIGRPGDDDIRDRTVHAMMARYHVDAAQADRVARTAANLSAQSAGMLALNDDDTRLLLWAARLHEVGMAVSHTGFHKHGDYLLRYSDMAGFSQPVQARLALLVSCHRRKIKPEQYNAMVEAGGLTLLRQCLLLRLAVLLHHSRRREAPPPVQLRTDGLRFSLTFPTDWLRDHPLLAQDLLEETEVFASVGTTLVID
jgi:exopolyphosphatase/guanosine-5'-triphosphate,3'-diphosphate pyrophosphatase